MTRTHSNIGRDYMPCVRTRSFDTKKGLLRSLLARYGVASSGQTRALYNMNYEVVLVCDDTIRSDETAGVQPTALSPWEEVTDTVMAVAEVACCKGPVNVWFRRGRPVFDICTFADSRLHDALRPEPTANGDASSLAEVVQAAVNEKAACKLPVVINIVTHEPPLSEMKQLCAVARRVWAEGSPHFQFQVVVCGGSGRAYRKFIRGTEGCLSVVGGYEAERGFAARSHRRQPTRGDYILSILTAPILHPIQPDPVSEPAPLTTREYDAASRHREVASNVHARREECCLIM